MIHTMDLIDSPWISVAGADGESLLGIEAALAEASQHALALASPLEEVALLRQVLLPVVLDALGPPRNKNDWATRWNAGSFDGKEIGSYLDRHRYRFNLFDEEQPFAQVGGLTSLSGETKPSSLLVPAAATGNNVPLFSTRTEADPDPLTPAQAARALLAAQCWDTAAIKTGATGDPRALAGKTTGNPTGPVGQLGVVIPQGRTLFETIMLNLPIVPDGIHPDDAPWWRRDTLDATWEPRPARGILDLLTWQSRRIRLFPELDGDAVVVRRVIVAAGDRLAPLPIDIEPHTAWRTVDEPKAGEPSRRAVRHQSGRAIWRGMPGLLAVGAAQGIRNSQKVQTSRLLEQIGDLRSDDLLPSDLPLQVLAVGVEYGNQSAVVENVIADTLPLPVAALAREDTARHLLVQVVKEAEDLRAALNFLADDLRQAANAESIPWDKGQRPGDQMLTAFDPVMRRLLAGVQREPERFTDAYLAWRDTARRIALDAAESVLEAASPQTFLGRGEGNRSYRLSGAEMRYRKKVREAVGDGNESADIAQEA